MTTLIRRSLALLALGPIATVGCTPGGGSAGDGSAGAHIAVAAYGHMTGSGVVVNDVTYDTTNAVVTIDGTAASVADLAAGDIVLVTGTLDSIVASTGVADRIDLEHALIGPIESVDVAADSVIALGQTVRLAQAVFDASIPRSSVQGLAIGDLVVVSGFRKPGNELIATRIGKRGSGSSGFKAMGRVVNLDDTAKRFDINALRVDYASAVVTPGPSGSLLVGSGVAVSGAAVGPAGELIAEQVVFKRTDVKGNPGVYVDVEGYVTGLDPSNSLIFEVAGLPVIMRLGSVVDGLLASDARIEVRGELSADGAAIANRVHSEAAAPRGTHVVEGRVFDAYIGPMANVPVSVWVQSGNFGYSWSWVAGAAVGTDRTGQFRVTGLPDSQVWLWAGGLQPCAVTMDVRGDVTQDVEVVSPQTLSSLDPPRPQAARDPTLVGAVFEITSAGREPVAGAWIVADAWGGAGLLRGATQTDLSGRYFLCGLPANTDLQVHKDGYVTKEIWPVGGSQSMSLDIEIERE
jgi:Domain of unknown function (DUF5666)